MASLMFLNIKNIYSRINLKSINQSIGIVSNNKPFAYKIRIRDLHDFSIILKLDPISMEEIDRKSFQGKIYDVLNTEFIRLLHNKLIN